MDGGCEAMELTSLVGLRPIVLADESQCMVRSPVVVSR